jgi:predicted MFS family arabinose efflux permease
MYIGSITGIAWLLKIVWGYLADSFLTKKTWFLLSLGGSLLLSLVLGAWFYPITVVVALLTIASTCSSIRDVNTDGIACIEGKRSNLTGKLQSVQWGSITVATLAVGLVGGYIAQNLDYRVAYIGLIPLYLVAGWFIWRYKEKKTSRKKTSLIATFSKYTALWKDKRFVYTCLFLFFYCYAPSFGTVLSFIQRDVFGFSEIYIGIMIACFSLCQIVGAIIYYRLCNRINLQKWLVISVFIGAITTLCYLYYTPVTIWIYGICFAVVGMFVHLILLDTMARVSIKGLEATSFALLCGIYNLATTASMLSGAYLFPKIGLKPLIIVASLTSFVCLFWVSKLKIDKHNLPCKRTTCAH